VLRQCIFFDRHNRAACAYIWAARRGINPKCAPLRSREHELSGNSEHISSAKAGALHVRYIRSGFIPLRNSRPADTPARLVLRARDSHYALISTCEWARTKPAIMAYGVPTILDATNIGLGFIDVMRDQIVHCDLDFQSSAHGRGASAAAIMFLIARLARGIACASGLFVVKSHESSCSARSCGN
jgi:hypothetical protein